VLHGWCYMAGATRVVLHGWCYTGKKKLHA
jgi:hypothetical protein